MERQENHLLRPRVKYTTDANTLSVQGGALGPANGATKDIGPMTNGYCLNAPLELEIDASHPGLMRVYQRRGVGY